MSITKRKMVANEIRSLRTDAEYALDILKEHKGEELTEDMWAKFTTIRAKLLDTQSSLRAYAEELRQVVPKQEGLGL